MLLERSLIEGKIPLKFGVEGTLFCLRRNVSSRDGGAWSQGLSASDIGLINILVSDLKELLLSLKSVMSLVLVPRRLHDSYIYPHSP